MNHQEQFCSLPAEKLARLLHKISVKGPCCCCVYSIDDVGCFDANCAHGIELWLQEECKKKPVIQEA